MNIQQEDLDRQLDRQDIEETHMQEEVAMVAQATKAAATEAPEASDQELVSSHIPVDEEPSTQDVEDVEDVEGLDIENDESLVVENRSKMSKTKKALKYLTSKKKRAVLRRAFHMWQRKPHEVAPLSEDFHECTSCGTEYQGNYCPRCGQSASIGRFSFKKATLLFLDVWGMGNRSMFRSLRDLMLRPGYMIRDYLSGMQSAYFPPFKMFFLLLTFSFIIEQGISLNTDATDSQPNSNQTEMVTLENEEPKNEEPKKKDAKKEINDNANKKLNTIKSKMNSLAVRFANLMNAMSEKYPAIFSLVTILLFFWPMYFFLRHSPRIPNLRFSEFIVAMIYISNTFTIFLILGDLFNSYFIKFFAVFMIFVAISQFTGYKKWRILGYMILTFVISLTAFIIVCVSGLAISSLLV